MAVATKTSFPQSLTITLAEDDGPYDDHMDPRRGPYRSPSPGHHGQQQGYQLDDHPYGHQPQNLNMPDAHYRMGTPSDQLNLNAAVGAPLARSPSLMSFISPGVR